MKLIDKFKQYFIDDTIIPTSTNLYSVYDTNTNGLRYKVMTKDNYIEYMLNNKGYEMMISENAISKIEENWNRLSKGYNFVIAVGRYDSLMFYSVEYFNKQVAGR